jgi:metal-responsive CopG/Arc/MetJ family transcriptional regulator
MDLSLIDRLDRVVRLGEQRGHPISRSEIIRDATDSYLEAIEKEFKADLSGL